MTSHRKAHELKKYLVYHRRPGGHGKITSVYDKEVRKEEEEVQRKFEPLPEPPGNEPFHLSLDEVLPHDEIVSIKNNKKIVFHTVGDTGGIYQGEYQQLVAEAMEGDYLVETKAKPSFFYHLGDVVYFRGEAGSYYPQFYEPYRNYPAIIFAIPGNHDGMTIPGNPAFNIPPDPPTLTSFINNFCTKEPSVSPDALGIPRYTMIQPNVYWTLETPFVNIIGLYSNIHEMDGDIREPQLSWFVKELQNAPEDKALIVAVHHPAYSADNVHGGSRKVGEILDKSFEKSGKKPNIVLSGHVHNYQRYSREIDNGKQIPYIVAGAGGYYHLHHLQRHNNRVRIEVPYTMEDSGTVLEKYSDDRYGFMRIEVSKDVIKGTYYGVAYQNESDHSGTRQIDTFEIDWHNYKITKGSSI